MKHQLLLPGMLLAVTMTLSGCSGCAINSDTDKTGKTADTETSNSSSANDQQSESTDAADQTDSNQTTTSQNTDNSGAAKTESGQTQAPAQNSGTPQNSDNTQQSIPGSDHPISVDALLADPQEYTDAGEITILGVTGNGSPYANGEPSLSSPYLTSASEVIALKGASVRAGSVVQLTGTFSEDSGRPVFNADSCTVLQVLPGTYPGPETVTNPKQDTSLPKGTEEDPLTAGILPGDASSYTGQSGFVIMGQTSSSASSNGNPALGNVGTPSGSNSTGFPVVLTGETVPVNSLVRLTGSFSASGNDYTFDVDSCDLIQSLSTTAQNSSN